VIFQFFFCFFFIFIKKLRSRIKKITASFYQVFSRNCVEYSVLSGKATGLNNLETLGSWDWRIWFQAPNSKGFFAEVLKPTEESCELRSFQAGQKYDGSLGSKIFSPIFDSFKVQARKYGTKKNDPVNFDWFQTGKMPQVDFLFIIDLSFFFFLSNFYFFTIFLFAPLKRNPRKWDLKYRLGDRTLRWVRFWRNW